MIKGRRKCMGPRVTTIRYHYLHYFIRLREGKPPKEYFEKPMDGNEKFEEYIQELRDRRIKFGL